MTEFPEPWQLYPMPPEQVAKIRAYIARMVEQEAAGRASDVAGAVAGLMRDTDSTDPAYEGVRRAYGVALEAAGLVPRQTA